MSNRKMSVESGRRFLLPHFVYMVCCDCGLKHIHRYEILRKGNRNYLYLTAWRANHKRKEDKHA